MMPTIKTSDGIAIHYQIDGREDGPPLVISNSLGINLNMWEWQMAEAARTFRVVRYDQRGHGGSEAPEGPYTMERLGRDVVDLLDGLDIRRTAFLGLSMGGMTGMWLAANEPGRFTRMALCNTSAFFPDKSVWDQRMELVRGGGMQAVKQATIERWFTSAFREKNPQDVEKVAGMIEICKPEGYLGCCAAIREMDLREDVKRIDMPCLIVIGRHDPATVPAFGELIASTIPGAQSKVLDTAHLSNVEDPEGFNRTVFGFLREHGA
jgi:3-oxoadipate enol-lactonase